MKITFEYEGERLDMELCAVESSNIAAIGYLPSCLLLAVQFKSASAPYFYPNFPVQLWLDFNRADSKGSYFHRLIKSQFKFIRLDVSEAAAEEITADDLPQAPGFDESSAYAELGELITGLAKGRVDLQSIRAEFDLAKQDFMESQEIVAIMKREQELAAQVSDFDTAVRQLALRIYGQNGKKQLSEHVSVHSVRVLEYDESKAFEHCRNHLHNLLDLNKGRFEKYARAVEDTAPLPFVTISKVSRVSIATDLSGNETCHQAVTRSQEPEGK